MVAREDSGQIEFDERLNGSAQSWSEDQLTTKYTMAAFQDLEHHAHGSTPPSAAWGAQDEVEVPARAPASWIAESSWDHAPHVLEVRDLRAPVPARPSVPTGCFQGHRTMPIPYGQLGLPTMHTAPRVTLAPTSTAPARLPSPLPARPRSRRTSTLPGMRPQYPALETGPLPPSRPRISRNGAELDEPNPFARPSFFSRTSVRAVLAAVGLFGVALSADAHFNNRNLLSGALSLPGADTLKALAAAVSGPLSQPFSTPAPTPVPAPAPPEPVAPPVAAQPGASSDSAEDKAEKPGASDQLSAKERRAQKYKERREAAKARREEAKQARLEKAQARREAAQARHAAWLERREASSSTRNEARQARLEKLQEQREAAQARREEAKQARLEKAQARREALEAKRAEAREQRDAAALARRQNSSDDSSSMLDSSPVDTSSSSAKVSSGASGTLRVNSRPWSEVFVDGRKVGTTPQLAINLTPGRHKVRLVNSQFAVSKNLDVDVKAGESVTRVELLDN